MTRVLAVANVYLQPSLICVSDVVTGTTKVSVSSTGKTHGAEAHIWYQVKVPPSIKAFFIKKIISKYLDDLIFYIEWGEY